MMKTKELKEGLKVKKEKWLGKGSQFCVTDGKKRAVYTSSFLKQILKDSVNQEIELNSFGTAALCAYAFDLNEAYFSVDDVKIFKDCSVMIDNNTLSLCYNNFKDYLHIPLANIWQDKFKL